MRKTEIGGCIKLNGSQKLDPLEQSSQNLIAYLRLSILHTAGGPKATITTIKL